MKAQIPVILAFLNILLVACGSRVLIVPTPTFSPSFSLEYFDRRPTKMAKALTLRIVNLTSECNEFDEPLYIKLTFSNLQHSPLILYKGFQISNIPMATSGYIAAQIQSSSGVAIAYGPEEAGRRHLFADTDEFTTIQPEGDFEVMLEYYFPTENSYPAPLSSDKYMVSFIYNNMFPGPNDPSDIRKYFDYGAWMGEIESNQIEVCMTHD